MKNSFKLFILAHKNNRGIHKKVVYTVIMILIFLLLIIPFSIFKTYDNELKRFENEDDSAKIISFYYDEKENYEKIKNKVEESKYFIKEKDYTMPFKNGYFEEISDSLGTFITCGVNSNLFLHRNFRKSFCNYFIKFFFINITLTI